MITKEPIYLSYHTGIGWTSPKRYFCDMITPEAVKVDADMGVSQAGYAYRHITDVRNSHSINLIINNSTLYSNNYTEFSVYLKNFYKAQRQRLSYDNSNFVEVTCNETDILGLDYLEGCKEISSIALTFIDKERKEGDYV